MKTGSLVTAFWLSAAAFSLAQPAAQPLSFEVASIKPKDCGGLPCRVMIRYLPGGGYVAEGVTLKLLIGGAYNVRDFQIEGGPGWITSDRFDLDARPDRAGETQGAADDVAKMTDEQRKTFSEQMRERVRNLLADRFQLVLHPETKEQQVYALEVAKGGPKLKKSPHGDGRMRFGLGSLDGNGVQMGFLAMNLSTQLSRPVIDKTGLTGKYDLTLTWTPGLGQTADGPFGPLPPGVQPADPNGPSVFTVLQEQLGLRLRSEKWPVEILVIDRAEKPSEN